MKAGFLHPRYWGVWLLLAGVRVLTWLPDRLQVVLGRWLGRLLRRFARRRWQITLLNLQRCFPELDSGARATLAERHFDSLGLAFIEIGLCWWGDARSLRRRVRIEGLEHLRAARAAGRGVILLTGHFTTLEIGGRLLGLFTDFHLLYRPHQNPLIEYLMRRSRERHFERAIPRQDVRLMLKSLKEGKPVWYAPDQGYRGKHSAMVPFFGVPAPTNVALARLVRLSGAPVVPFFVERLPGARGYLLSLRPALEGFPGDDPAADALRINRLLEEQIRRVPEQYLWSHDRFKSVPRD